MAHETYELPTPSSIAERYHLGEPPISINDNADLIASRGFGANPFEQSAELLGGIPAGFVNRSQEFVEFLAQPHAVDNALIGIGPVLDNAVNYYADHIRKGTTSQIAKDAASAVEAIKQEITHYSELPAQKRGEVLGGMWVDILLAEAAGDFVQGTMRANALIERPAERLVPGFEKCAGAGGDWKVINERFSPDVVVQTEPDSCVAASGEMLTNGERTQGELFLALRDENDPRPGRNTLMLADVLGPEWESARYSKGSLDFLLMRGPFAAELKDWTIPGRPGENLAHTVVIDGADKGGLLRVRDPQHGTRYEMMRDEFLRVWTGAAVWCR